MVLFRNAAQPFWQAERWEFSGKAERNPRDIAHASLLVFAVAAVAASILAGISLSSELGLGTSSSFIAVAILFPFLCGLLAKELWHAKKLETHINVKEARFGLAGSRQSGSENALARLLIVSLDLRVRFANQKYLESTFQEPEEVFGWKIQDVLPVEDLEDRAQTVLDRSDPAASCCFNALIQGGSAGERPVHITLTRIAPRHGEDCILVVVEDLFPGCSPQVGELVEGYLC